MSKYRTSWSEIQEQMNEFALSHTVRYRDPLNKKRFAVPFKTAEKAKAKMDQLKRDGVKEIEITKDILRGKFKEEVEIQESDAYDNNRYMMKKYMGQILARPDNSNTKDGKDHVYAPNAKIAKQLYSQGKKVYREEVDLQETNPMGYTVKFANRKGARIATAWYKDEADAKKALEMIKKNGGNGIISKGRMDEETIVEDGHTDVPSSKRMAQVISEDAQLIIKELNKKSDEDELPTWWTNKLAVSAHNMNAARDYITDNIKEDLEEAMSDAQLKKVRDSYKDLKTISPEKVKTLKNFLDRYSTDSLMQLAQANINFVSTMARSVMNKRKMGDPKHAGSMREEKSDMERIADLRTRQMMLQTKLKDMDPGDPKDKTPMAITKNDIENIQMKMDQIRQKQQKEEVELQEKIEGLANKSEKSGVPYGILKKVYDRGMAAWKGGHRPGTTPQQWAFARVNSFLTGGKTRTTADADLWQKAKAAKSKK